MRGYLDMPRWGAPHRRQLRGLLHGGKYFRMGRRAKIET
jgi:hypothetical protein